MQIIIFFFRNIINTCKYLIYVTIQSIVENLIKRAIITYNVIIHEKIVDKKLYKSRNPPNPLKKGEKEKTSYFPLFKGVRGISCDLNYQVLVEITVHNQNG